ncbi:MAG: ABC transporter ATP-binding protein, partial [Thermoleophilia bacterium]|nr:ABC transporter ATP-binding protein [Thermoleophilia bacterium]
ALLVASGANLLVLDEPTNHLDLESREALEAALEAFPGTVLLVSHDRAVLDAVPDRIVAIEGGALRSYEGGWADLVREREAGEPEPAAAPPHPAPPRERKRSPARRTPTELDRTETRITELESHVATLEERLAENWSDVDLLASHRAARDELQRLLARWEELFEAAGADSGERR